MRTARKSSAKSAASSKGVMRRKTKPDELSRLTRQLHEMLTLFAKLQASGILTLARELIHHRPRRPLPEYAKVVAVGAADEVSEVRGRTGIVLDAAELAGDWTYTVYFPTYQQTFVLHEISLWDTGDTVPEDVIYGGGEMRRVRVDADGNSVLLA